MDSVDVVKTDVPAAQKVGGAVGVEARRWLVARVSNNTEKKSRDTLLQKGYQAFAATQREVHDWKGHRAEVEVVRVSTYLFVYVSRSEQDTIIHFPFIKSFLMDRTSTITDEGLRSHMVISERDIQRLKYMLHQSDTPVDFIPTTFSKGDYVRVRRSSMQGLVGQLVRVDSRGGKRFGVNISGLGCATMQIPPSELEIITEKEYLEAQMPVGY